MLATRGHTRKCSLRAVVRGAVELPSRIRHRAFAVALVTIVAVVGSAVPGSAQQTSLSMASKNFSGAQVLTQVYGQALAAQGAHVTFTDDVGRTEVVFPALQAGTFDAYADYQGTLLTYLGGKPTANSARTHAALVEKLQGTGITVSEAAPAVDVNGFFVTRKTAKKYDLRTVSDLKKVAPDLSIGGPPECPNRPLCLGDASQRAYGLQFASVVPIDPNGPATQRALRKGDIDVAVLFTGSSVIPKDAVLLRDDKGLQPADNPVLVLRVAAATADTVRVANAVSAAVTTSAYNDMSLAISRDRKDPTEVAARFLAQHSLP
jgi:osmoprotectant transport system substrate-binding protein